MLTAGVWDKLTSRCRASCSTTRCGAWRWRTFSRGGCAIRSTAAVGISVSGARFPARVQPDRVAWDAAHRAQVRRARAQESFTRRAVHRLREADARRTRDARCERCRRGLQCRDRRRRRIAGRLRSRSIGESRRRVPPTQQRLNLPRFNPVSAAVALKRDPRQADSRKAGISCAQERARMAIFPQLRGNLFSGS